MKTEVQTPMEIFFLPQQLQVPLFQRPYVWREDEQWAPLWQDIRRLAELKLSKPFSTATHFLGAVVLQGHDTLIGRLPASNIIDGQQRLTTLQIIMDAAALVLDEAGLDILAGQLESLTHNQSNFLQPGQSRLKLMHSNKDHAAFDEVMNVEPPVDHVRLKHSESLIVQAHNFFARSITQWLGARTAKEFDARADSLVTVLLRGLQLVVINLGADENSQEIFETLNARGTPLTASDLIKNFVFQRLTAEGGDTKQAYAEDWPFDTKFWEAEVSVGRHNVSRSSLFLNQWLISRTGDEIGPQSTFTRFKSFVEHESGHTITELLPLIKQQAALYEKWTAAASEDGELTVVEMCVYRMQANGIEVLKPLLIWLHSPDRSIQISVIDEVVTIAESWLVRRQLLSLTGSDLGRIVSDVIRVHREAAPTDLAASIQSHLTRLSVSSTYWPGDHEIRLALSTESTYRRFKRGRLRVLLESIENSFRSESGQPQVPRKGYPIEHVMPQKWETSWPVDGLEAEQERAAHIHRFGNLTLLTKTLNSKVSNGPWLAKRESFKEHDTFLLTSRLVNATNDQEWDEYQIDRRTEILIDALLKIFPVPVDHVGLVTDAPVKEADIVEIKDLVIAGLLNNGTRLKSRPGKWNSVDAIVRADGHLEVDGKTFTSLSGAGSHVRGGATNGWYFWRLDDGRTLKDVRDAYRSANTADSTGDGEEASSEDLVVSI